MPQRPLPAEVLSQIFKVIEDRYDLCSISLASSALRGEAQRALFRNPGRMTIGHDVLPRSKFLDTIILSPHRLAPAVRSFQLEMINWHLSPRRHKISIVEKLHCALLFMVNLKTVSVWAPSCEHPADPPGPLPHILRDCTFQLEAFTWIHVAGDELLLLKDFLPLQHRLKELAFPRYIIDNREFCASAFNSTLGLNLNRNLESLRCSVSMTSALLSPSDKRKVSLKFLRWSYADSSFGLHTELNRSFNSVLLLHSDMDPIGARFDGPLTYLAPNFTKVTFLMMRTERLQAAHMTNVRVSILLSSRADIDTEIPQYFDTLALMPSLQVLVLSLQYGVPANRDAEAEEVAEAMFGSCRKFVCMDARSEMQTVGFTRRYTRWTEHGLKVECVALSDDDEEYTWDKRHLFV